MSEQTVGWALHALEPDEELEVIEHLAGCAECRRVAADVAGVTTGLATALPQYEPPRGLRDAIMEEARRTPQAGRGHGERVVPGDRIGSGPAGPEYVVPSPGRRPAPALVPPRQSPSSRPEPARGGAERPAAGPGRRRARRGPSGRTGRALLATAAIVAVLVGGGVLAGQIQALRSERDASIAQAQQMEDVLGALAKPGTTHAFLASPTDPSAAPMAAVIVQDGRPEVMPMALAPNQVDDQTYVLWGLNGDANPQAVGTFDVRTGINSPMSVASPGSGTYEQYAVSLERGRVAPPAPSAVVAAGRVET
ncbi:hypothetical protein AD006_15220 [Pseudonocardia sp. EC080610-09]|uniref:anti-sigma factor n=1 Tax=unclassified Pseudonocardia TaxID=2619320 RepID=UPI0006CB0C8A|nr:MULTISPECIES: anti-sigma factor [unclassified Pseudonocardia]ALE72991.1 hypothetical protein FRP1_07590 [Pseudonocardia sp. EC080625-04]ALL76320.1 hypothetical protein AD006_15220 [Pseudonocardia sp. EC080610-09]ALL83347.1 hypothetical protein AD017_23060 [Pseudonocardia sp. EC080619-01]